MTDLAKSLRSLAATDFVVTTEIRKALRSAADALEAAEKRAEMAEADLQKGGEAFSTLYKRAVIYREALEFFADVNNYVCRNDVEFNYMVVRDGWYIADRALGARQALAAETENKE